MRVSTTPGITRRSAATRPGLVAGVAVLALVIVTRFHFFWVVLRSRVQTGDDIHQRLIREGYSKAIA